MEHMTSAELNEKLASISDEDEKYGYEAFGGKAIPYIGWYWRSVDFDAVDGYLFGILPVVDGLDSNDVPRVGFMENNKWDYDHVRATEAQWSEIKRLLIAVAKNPCRETLSAADYAIQALLTEARR